MRRISLVALASEDDAIAHQIAEATRQALVETCLPGLRQIAPGATFRTDFSDGRRRRVARSQATPPPRARRGGRLSV